MSIPNIFISYSHDSAEHCEFVRGLSDRLRKEGLNCQIDLYINGSPPEGWQRWMGVFWGNNIQSSIDK